MLYNGTGEASTGGVRITKGTISSISASPVYGCGGCGGGAGPGVAGRWSSGSGGSGCWLGMSAVQYSSGVRQGDGYAVIRRVY